jgi:hypothetical protein
MLIECYKDELGKLYQRTVTSMKSRGAGKVWDWKPQHIEAKLVELGFEEPTVDERTNHRRRTRVARRAPFNNVSHFSQHHQPQHAPTIMPGDWALAGGHAMLHGQQYFGRRPSYDLTADDEAATLVPPGYNQDQQNEYLDQIFTQHLSCSSADEMDVSGDEVEVKSERDMADRELSARVARQACEQINRQNAALRGDSYRVKK